MSFQKYALLGTVRRLWRGICYATGTLLTGIIAVFLYIVTGTLFHIRVRGLHNFTVSPSAIIVISHKRDMDEVVCLSNLHVHKTLFRPRFRIRIAARDDLFECGFLPTHFKLPDFVANLLSWVNIAFIMKVIGSLPIGRPTHSRTGRLLRDVYKNEGNKELKDILKEEWIKKFASLLPPRLNSSLRNTRLKDFLGYEYCTVHAQSNVSGILKRNVSKRTKLFLLEQVFNQLGRFSKILNDGGILFMTPGDDHSVDGRFGAVRSGIHRLINMAQADVRICPSTSPMIL